MIEQFEQKLQKYAEVIVKVGLNLQPGQRLVIGGPYTRGVDLELAPLVRLIASSAYQAGCRYVEVLWGDPALRLMQYRQAPRDSFDEFPEWRVNLRLDYLKRADAILSISADAPDLLKGQDTNLIGKEMHAVARYNRPVREYITRNAVNWCVIAGAVQGWAARVFPDLEPGQQLDNLWATIFKICRVDQPDPLSAWAAHERNLISRAEYFNTKGYDALHYRGPGTDLTVGLPAGARWKGGGDRSESGIDFIANLPTEEVFSLPHRERIDGTLRASLPLNWGGNLIEDIHLVFEKGRVVKANARGGEEVLKQLLATDENAASLGEVSFVPYTSPISQTRILFYNTLIDENAASHMAFGNAYRYSLHGGVGMNDEAFAAAGGNLSGVHVDFMVGSNELDVDGITRDGAAEPVMRQGEWAFDVQ